MSDLRLESLPFEHGGKVYTLRCNMNVLADVQEENGGDISPAFDWRRGMKTVLQFLAAMMNDWADLQGWPERFTARSLGRVLRVEDVPMDKIIRLVLHAMTPPETANAEASGEQPGN